MLRSSMTESDETFTIRLSNSTGGATISGDRVQVAIRDNDPGDDEPSMPNSTPVISGTPAGTVEAGSAYDFQPIVSDADGDTLTFRILNRPVWASFNSETGRLWGTPSDAMAGTYGNIVLSVSDDVASVSLSPFVIVVSSADALPPAPPAQPPQSPQPTSTRSGGGHLGLLSLLLLGTAGLLRRPHRRSMEASTREN
jgi:hypothetical protein